MPIIDDTQVYVTGCLYKQDAYPDDPQELFDIVDEFLRQVTDLSFWVLAINRSETRFSGGTTREQLLIFLKDVIYNGKQYHDLGLLVYERFQIGWVVIVYILALLFLGFHLYHGFQSAFQTLVINHKIYTPFIKTIGVIYTIIITLGFISIPVYIYFLK